MSDVIVCPSCAKNYAYKPELAGKRVRCKCGGTIDVAKVAPPADEPPDLEGALASEWSATEAPASPATPPRPMPIAAPIATVSKPKSDDDKKWWYYAGFGVVMIVIGIYEYSRLSQLDAGEVDSVRVTRVEHVVYSIGGSIGVLIACLLGAALLIGFGVYQLMEERKQKSGRV